MMLKEKSNSWARLKLVLLVPVAACSMLAFARPDVNRELTNLMQSEDTTISPVGQPYTREFFDKEIDRYIGQAGRRTAFRLGKTCVYGETYAKSEFLHQCQRSDTLQQQVCRNIRNAGQTESDLVCIGR